MMKITSKSLLVFCLLLSLVVNMFCFPVISNAEPPPGVSLQVYTRHEGLQENNIIKPRIYLQNTGTVTLNSFDLYYYFTAENGKTPVVDNYYMPNPQPQVSLVDMGEGLYAVKLHFTGANFAPSSIMPDNAGYAFGIHYSDWSVMDKSNDYSYTGDGIYVINDKVTVYGISPDVPTTTLYFGTPPGNIKDYVITYVIRLDWGTGASVDVSITNNTNKPLNGWNLKWTFPGNQQITQIWGGIYTQNGNSVVVRNVENNRTIAPNGGKAMFTFNLSYTGQNLKPNDIVLNGPFITDLDQPAPDESANIKKYIVSDIGATVKYNSYINESVTQRVYYKNPTTQVQNLVITDDINTYCDVVQIYNGGAISGGNILWTVNNVAPGGTGFVEVKVTSAGAGVVTNNARLNVQNTVYQSNETSIHFAEKPEKGWIPLIPDANPGEKPTANMKEDSTTGFMCNFNIPGLTVSEVKNGDTTYQNLSIPGYDGQTDIGKPALPVMGNIFEVPDGVDFDVEIYKSSYITVKDFKISPLQDDLAENMQFDIDKSAYVHNAVMPLDVAVTSNDGIAVIRGHRLLFVNLNPVQYNAATGELKIYSNIEFKVNFSEPAQVEDIPDRLESKPFEDMLKKAVTNFEDDDDDPSPVPVPTGVFQGCDYLILTHGSFHTAADQADQNSALNRFAKWKRQKGLTVGIVDVADIKPGNAPTAADIQSFISNAYDTWARVPSYILLVGDSDLVPTNYTTSDMEVASDTVYAEVDGNDYYPDIYIGRLSVDTTAECSTVVDKIIDYEKDPTNDPDYYTDCTFVMAFEDRDNNDGQEGRRRIEISEDMLAHADNNGYNVTRVYGVDYGPGAPPAGGPARYENGTALPNNLTQAGGFQWNGSANDIATQINNGNWLVIYGGHGSPDGWSNPPFHNNDVNNLTNAGLLPAVFSWTCQAGHFDNETDGSGSVTESFCETFLRSANGCAGIIGSSRNSNGTVNDYARAGTYKALRPDYNPNPPVTPNRIPRLTMGPLQELAQVKDFSLIFSGACVGNGPVKERSMQEYNVFGDPNMAIWTHEPDRFDVEYPTEIGGTGIQDFVVKVTDDDTGDPQNSATVTLVRDGQLLQVRQTDAGGYARFTIYPGNGDITLTVTKLNYRPFEEQISVSGYGGSINQLTPQDGTAGQTVTLTYSNFTYTGGEISVPETVDVYFNGTQVTSTNSGTATFNVPAGTANGSYNIVLEGTISGRHAVDVFKVRGANPVDLYSYSQWDSSTYNMTAGNDPTWNSPDIQLYDTSNNPVNSGDLTVTSQYRIRSVVHNDTDFNANNATVTFKWANFGVGQPDVVWNTIGTQTVNVNANSTANAEIMWTPPLTGHICIMAEIYHVEDVNQDNNKGQENCSVGVSHSPAVLNFDIWNPTSEDQQVYFVLRQVSDNSGTGVIWPSTVNHPDPQTIEPGQVKQASISIDPTLINVLDGTEEFSLTGYINGEIVGGVNFIVVKEP